jgi:hypothetical protein
MLYLTIAAILAYDHPGGGTLCRVEAVMINIPLCVFCKNFHKHTLEMDTMTCKAFPDGIPFIILSNEMPHYDLWEKQVEDCVYEPE